MNLSLVEKPPGNSWETSFSSIMNKFWGKRSYFTLVTFRHLMCVLLLQKVLLSCCSQVVWSPPSSYPDSCYSGITQSLRTTLISDIVLELSSLSTLLQTGLYIMNYVVTFSCFGPYEIQEASSVKNLDNLDLSIDIMVWKVGLDPF